MSYNNYSNQDANEVMDVASSPMPAGGNPAQTAGDLISQGSQLLQIRTRNQLMVAVQRPRDLKVFEGKLLAIAAEAGEDFFYSIPYKNRKEGTTTNVEGAGVGLARAAAALYGNCSVDTRIEQEVTDCFLVRSDFVDFETNYTRSETKRVSKLMPKYGGGTRLSSGKELDLVYQQGASKVERDVILRSLPKHIIERAFETAKAAALAEKAPIAQQIARLLRRFGELEVGIGRIEAYLGCPFTEKGMADTGKDPREVCAHLRGVLTAIKGGDTTVEEIFGQAQQGPSQAPASQAPGAIKAEDLARPSAQPTTQPSTAPAAAVPGNGNSTATSASQAQPAAETASVSNGTARPKRANPFT